MRIGNQIDNRHDSKGGQQCMLRREIGSPWKCRQFIGAVKVKEGRYRVQKQVLEAEIEAKLDLKNVMHESLQLKANKRWPLEAYSEDYK
jgi:hypothetical protein